MNGSAAAGGAVGRALDLACRACAVLGGLLLAGLALAVVGSIAGRACCDAPVPGDYELAQIAVAVAVSLCLPWCQLHRGHIAVDFFTTRLAPRRQIRLDALGALILALVCGLLAWRTGVGAADMFAAGETTMILGFPLWLGYAAAVPGLALAGVAALYGAAHDWRRSYRWP